ncbi:hypothetical protein GCM10022253_23300 [Sphingomonas endophytica]|uniref:Uncharacterized protein n=1 Tax=Sphingomonas endophytica TaxID=869719 RepID=A0ABR6N4F6_9SPHN|nr:hypothetical protein [Sphingomonas endophytica]MBB5724976.1 hypothetical protein [Sphingomonas endophytica]
MFVDFRDQPPPPPWQPPRRRPRLTPRQEKTLAAIIGFNIVLLIIAPIGGATLIGVLALLWR